MPQHSKASRKTWRNHHRSSWIIISCIAPAFALVRALSADWQPEGDDATIIIRSREALHGQFPLQGMRSTLGGSDTSLANHHLGPLELHILLPASILGSAWAIALTCCLVVAICSVATVVWAHRFGGDPGLVIFGSGLLIVQWALGPEALFRPFNPYFGLLPIYLGLVLLAAHMTGMSRAAWPLVAVTAVIGQANLAYLPIAGGVAGVALSVSLCRVWRDRKLATQPAWWRRTTLSAQQRASLRRTRVRRGGRPFKRIDAHFRSLKHINASFLVFVAVWAPALAESFRYDPGNLTQLAKAALAESSPTQGRTWAAGRLGQLAPTPGGFRTLGFDLVYEYSTTAVAIGWALTGLLVLAGVPWGLARSRQMALPPAWAALTGIVLLLATSARLPETGLANHYLASAIPVTVFAWAALIWRFALQLPHIKRRFKRAVGMQMALLAAAIAVLLALLVPPLDMRASSLADGVADLAIPTSEVLPSGSHLKINGRGFLATLSTAPALALQLERRGFMTHYLFGWPYPEDAQRLAKAKAPEDSVEMLLIGDDAEDKTLPPDARHLGEVSSPDGASISVYLIER